VPDDVVSEIGSEILDLEADCFYDRDCVVKVYSKSSVSLCSCLVTSFVVERLAWQYE
jgi:hypothetical protein